MQNEQQDPIDITGESFKQHLLSRDFEAATNAIKIVDNEHYAIDEYFHVEDMIEVVNSYRDDNKTVTAELLQKFYAVFAEGNQSDFFWYIDREDLEEIEDLRPLFPMGM